MRDPKRIAGILERLRQAWLTNPDLRLGQLIINAAGDKAYFVEDDELIDLIEERCRRWKPLDLK